MPFTVSQIIEAWHSVDDRWIVRRNKMHDTRQWEVVHDWGRDVVSDETMEIVGRYHTSDEAQALADDCENVARGGAVMQMINNNQ